VSFRVQQVDTPPHTTQYSFPRFVSITQVALNTTFDLTAEHFCHQIRNVIRVVLKADISLFEIPVEIRCVQHKQPEVAHRDAANPANTFMGV
jgi:hypothetical protein